MDRFKKNNDKIQLHMIGKLQSNKVRFAVQLFDYIHSLDNLKLARKIAEEQKNKIKNKTFHSSKYWRRKTKKWNTCDRG